MVSLFLLCYSKAMVLLLVILCLLLLPLLVRLYMLCLCLNAYLVSFLVL